MTGIFKRITAICIIFSILIGVTLVALKESDDANSPSMGFCVVIDPGHGGVDSGAIGVRTGNKESDLNLDLSLELEKYLASAGLRSTLTRRTQDGLYGTPTEGFKRRDMQARRDIINKSEADLVISIHMNKFPSAFRRGAQVFYQRGDEESRALAEITQHQLNLDINIPELNRSFSAQEGDFFICKIKKPAIIVECGFLSNAEDDRLLSSKSYRKRLAYTLFNGAVSYLIKESVFIPEA